MGGHVTVSVVVPMYNAEPYIRETLESVLAQTGVGLEVLVVDDGSVDRSRDIVEGFLPRVQYLHRENSGGTSKPRNFGLSRASGAFISFCDADDLLLSGKLEAQVAFLSAHPEVGLVVCDYRNFRKGIDAEDTHFATCPALSARLREADEEGVVLSPAEARRILAKENFLLTDTLMIRRSALDLAGGFDETLRSSEDFDLAYRLALSSPVGVLKRIGVRRRLHAGNKTGNVTRALAEKLRSRQKLLALETDPVARARLRDFVSGLHLSICEANTGVDDREAWRHLRSGVAAAPGSVRQLKAVARLGLSTVGMWSHARRAPDRGASR